MLANRWHDLEDKENQENSDDLLIRTAERGKTEGNRSLEGLQDTPFEGLGAEVGPLSVNVAVHRETEGSQVYCQSLFYLRTRLLDY